MKPWIIAVVIITTVAIYFLIFKEVVAVEKDPSLTVSSNWSSITTVSEYTRIINERKLKNVVYLTNTDVKQFTVTPTFTGGKAFLTAYSWNGLVAEGDGDYVEVTPLALLNYMSPDPETLTLVSGTPYTFTYRMNGLGIESGLYIITFVLRITSDDDPTNKVEAYGNFGIVII